jgi:tetratricopeptide (TPR) repeat protein
LGDVGFGFIFSIFGNLKTLRMRFISGFFLLLSLAAWAQDFSDAERLFKQRNYDAAEPVFERYLTAHPSHLKALEYLGDINGHQQDWPAAVSYYEKLKTAAPLQADYHYKYGGALGMYAKSCNKFKALGMIGDIRTAFEKAIALDPKHVDARWALLELYLQLPGVLGGSEAKAQKYAAELLALSPVDGWLAKGRIAEYFERYATAETFYKKAIETGGSKTTYQKLSDLYARKMNQPDKAKAVWKSYKG